MFCVHTTLDEVKNATITVHLGFVLDENSVQENQFGYRVACSRLRVVGDERKQGQKKK